MVFMTSFYTYGVSLSQMRICQPYGLQQRKGLSQYALVEPDTWEKVVNRVSGANFGRLYARTSFVGPLQYSKTCPHDLAGVRCLLLESIGLYSKNLQDHYYRKISILIAHYRDKYGVHVEAIPDETKRKEWLKNEVLLA